MAAGNVDRFLDTDANVIAVFRCSRLHFDSLRPSPSLARPVLMSTNIFTFYLTAREGFIPQLYPVELSQSEELIVARKTLHVSGYPVCWRVDATSPRDEEITHTSE